MKRSALYLSIFPFVFLALAACSSSKKQTPSGEADRHPSSEVAVKISGEKAFQLLSLINKVDAVNFTTSECSNGKCFEEGSITLLCVTANNGNRHSRANRTDPKNTCDIRANKLNGNKTKLSGRHASDAANLVSSANGLGRKEDAVYSCNRGHCLTKGVLNIACKYPDSVASERETVCHVASGPMPKETD